MKQPDLFDDMLEVYGESAGPISNASLYKALTDRAAIPAHEWDRKVPIGKAGQLHSPLKVRVRWWQQSLRSLGLLSRDDAAGRGWWALTERGRSKLTPAPAGRVLLGFSTDLGVGLWASAADVFGNLNEPIHLCLTSLPYPLRKARAYGGPTVDEYSTWAIKLLEPIVKHLVPGGSLAINVGSDIFIAGSPARSLYIEQLVLDLCKHLGLALMDRLIVWDESTPPGPMQWASRTRQQLVGKHEFVFWFAKDPKLARSSNLRVLQPHTPRHLRLVANGGEQRDTDYGDGAYRLRAGVSFANPTPGRIPGNVIRSAHRCPDKEAASRWAREHHLAVHGATMPLKLATFLVDFLCEPHPDAMVVDPCAGWFSTAKAAEVTGRRWLACELMGQYVLGGASRFRDRPGFALRSPIN